MKKYLSALALAIFVLWASGCTYSGKTIRGNGNLTTERRQTGDFNTLVLAGSMEIYITQGPLDAVRIEAESNLQPYIKLTHKEDELVVGFQNNVRIASTRAIKVYITAPHIESLNLVGSGDIRITGTLRSNHKIKLRVAGSGDLDLAMNAPEVNADIVGSGNIGVSGETRNLQLNILGSGDFKGKELKSEQTDVRIAGSGNAWVYASIKLKTSVLGSGNIYYRGDPSMETSSAGSGSVIKSN